MPGRPNTQVPVQDEDENIDLESRLTDAHHPSLRLWLRMLSYTTRLDNEVRSRLRARFDITQPRFDLMAQLISHPQGLRMGELSRRLMVTCGNVTAITDQLEQESLVERIPDPQDRRVYSVKLTASGRRSFNRMAQAHESWVAELMGGISAVEKRQLDEMLARMKQHLHATLKNGTT
jgi:DNA-binding MarR family transcriptional regulator